MLAAVLSTLTVVGLKSSSERKPTIALPDCASHHLDTDGAQRQQQRYHHEVMLTMKATTTACGHRMGSRRCLGRYSPIPTSLLDCTLGCRDIVMEIMKFISDEELLDHLMRYLVSFPDLVNVENCLPIVMQRRVWYCNNQLHMDFLSECVQNVPTMNNTELILGFSQFPPQFSSFIEKFCFVHLNNISTTKRQLIELMNATTSKIQRLKFTNFKFKDPETELPSTRTFNISPNLKTLSFNIDWSTIFQFCKKNSETSTLQFSSLNSELKKEIENPIVLFPTIWI
ncbi:predicted protein [Naegleria gruberi]|uniref:Predicted protein n=1 Tax=Naegleria gruberi TaxID=5762 RepID=D2VHE7_NAEGR|nr:uncharacterized protein NAEGRDRAFT_68190 [Naegleria gruberi]EFC43788.1 predicted protein [Naegleria gruberi]|eukprot:XP_002676532.1 predicted protein [Naegleria gruberi strain NEG-M]